ncbi:MAG: hypothetical protein U9O59_07365 [Actinomycetota bacterium]|nr:hypothetical protein [Actinomycetota bacterium]
MDEKNFDVIDLVELQLIGNTVSARLSEIEDIKKSSELVSARKEFEKEKESFEDISNDYNDMESRRKKLEDTIEIQSGKIKSNEEKLFGGKITSTKELEGYQEEVKILKQKNSEMEDRVLEMMIEMEDKSKKLNSAREEMEKKKADINHISNEIEERIEVLSHNIEGLKKRKESVISRIPEEYLKKYNEVKNKKNGIAVAVMKDNSCSVCNMQIPISEAEKMDDMDKLYRCPLCGRIAVMYRKEVDDIKKEMEA